LVKVVVNGWEWKGYMFGCISEIVMESVCVRDFRGLRVVPCGECVGGRNTVVTNWGRIGGRGEDRGESG
jgi:hypothetical protein